MIFVYKLIEIRFTNIVLQRLYKILQRNGQFILSRYY